MKIFLTVKPNAKRESVEKTEEHCYVVRVAVPPIEGRANEAVRRALAAHFGVAPSSVSILKGEKGRHKVVEVALPAK